MSGTAANANANPATAPAPANANPQINVHHSPSDSANASTSGTTNPQGDVSGNVPTFTISSSVFRSAKRADGTSTTEHILERAVRDANSKAVHENALRRRVVNGEELIERVERDLVDDAAGGAAAPRMTTEYHGPADAREFEEHWTAAIAGPDSSQARRQQQRRLMAEADAAAGLAVAPAAQQQQQQTQGWRPFGMLDEALTPQRGARQGR